ncbi:MAG TPA: hypothetical protein VGD72_08205 [Mycobacteriales bacterium]|jgi:hypothetical protein
MTSSSGRTPRGRRDNGLDASEYAAAGDVDPRVGEHLLDVLGLAGIAAYLQPSADLHPVTRTTTLPARPTDRLWVDRRHLAEAREVVAHVDAGTVQADPPDAGPPDAGTPPDGDPADRRRRRDDLDLDAAWQQILASWEAPPVDPRQQRAAEPAPEPPDRRPPDPEPPADVPPAEEPRRDPEPVVGLDVPFGPHEVVTDPDDEGFVPPAPPPVPRASRYTVLAIALVAAGLALFFRPGLLPVPESVSLVLGTAGILGGFATLVWRLRDGLDDDDDPDDGAVV